MNGQGERAALANAETRETNVTFRTLLLIKAAVCLVFGVYLLAAPASPLGVLGAPLAGAGLFTAREYGAAMAGTVLLAWCARGEQARDARPAILLDLLLYDAIGVVITVAVVVAGTLNALGWGTVAVYAFFTLGSGYLAVKEGLLAGERAPSAVWPSNGPLGERPTADALGRHAATSSPGLRAW